MRNHSAPETLAPDSAWKSLLICPVLTDEFRKRFQGIAADEIVVKKFFTDVTRNIACTSKRILWTTLAFNA